MTATPVDLTDDDVQAMREGRTHQVLPNRTPIDLREIDAKAAFAELRRPKVGQKARISFRTGSL